MSRSPYIDNIILTNKHSGKRTHKVQAFVIHHMAAKWTGKRCAEYFRDTPSRQASANYCIGYDGDVALNVEEGSRAWTSSSNWADQRAITYELANSKTGHPWEVSDKTINKLIVMLAEQHKRYGLKKASYTGDTNGTLWRHDWFAKTNCPGPYLGGKLPYIADEINKILIGEEKVDVSKEKPSSPSKPKLKSNNVIAQEVLAGKWGNGDERKRRLEAAGYNYNAVQNIVNQGAPSKPSAPKPAVSVGEVGSKVTLKSNASKYATGENIPSSVKGKTYTIQQKGTRNGKKQVLLKEIVSWVWESDLGGSSGTPSAPSPKPAAKAINVGSRVKLKSSASKYATGQNILSSVKNKTYTVQQKRTRNGRAEVLLKEIMSWVFQSDVQ